MFQHTSFFYKYCSTNLTRLFQSLEKFTNFTFSRFNGYVYFLKIYFSYMLIFLNLFLTIYSVPFRKMLWRNLKMFLVLVYTVYSEKFSCRPADILFFDVTSKQTQQALFSQGTQDRENCDDGSQIRYAWNARGS